MYAFGSNQNGVLGINNNFTDIYTPTLIPPFLFNGNRVVDVSIVTKHALALTGEFEEKPL